MGYKVNGSTGRDATLAILAESAQAADTNDESGVELQSVSAAEDFAKGKVTASATSLVANGKEQTVTPTKVTTGSGVEITLTEQADGTYKGSDGDTYVVSGNTGTSVDKYTLTVTSTSDSSKTVSLDWKITAASLSGATAYEVNPDDADDTSDTTFTYNGDDLNIGFVVNGTKLSSDDYDAKVYAAGGDTTNPVELKDAGSYVVQLTGKGDYAGSKANVRVTINKLDLSTADIEIADTTSSTAPSAGDITVNGKSLPEIDGVKAELKSGDLYDENGEYTYTVSATDTANVTGSKDVTFSKYQTKLDESKFTYDNATFGTEIDTDLDADADDQVSFDASKVAVTGTDGKKLTSDQYTIKVTKADGTAASVNDLKTPGTYNVTVVVNPKATNYVYGGSSATMTVKVFHQKDASVFVTIDGKLVGDNNGGGSYSKTYDGNAVVPTVVVRDADGNALTEGTDYTVTYKKQNAKTGEYEKVSEIKDQGNYQVVVTPGTGWKLDATSGDDITAITVNKVPVSDVDTNKDEQLFTNGSYKYAYQDGAAINPTYVFTQVVDGEDVEVEVPADAYKTTITQLTDADGKSVNKTVDAITEEGTYSVSFKDAADDDNYVISNGLTANVTVSAARTYKDVPANAWYAQAVADATKDHLMSGYAGTQFFGPEDTLTRAQTAQVMFNITGGSSWNDTYYQSSTGSYVTRFDDVDGSLWYAKAIAWADDLDVMTGYAGSNNFGPEDNVTREQFAQTLVNYAKQVKKYSAADASVLNSYADKSTVDSWATDAVAWAVQNGIMGQNSGLRATDTITRAEAAQMLVRFVSVLNLK